MFWLANNFCYVLHVEYEDFCFEIRQAVVLTWKRYRGNKINMLHNCFVRFVSYHRTSIIHFENRERLVTLHRVARFLNLNIYFVLLIKFFKKLS